MARGPRYNVPFRRRREGKTNYKRRYKLLLSGLPRLVARRTLRHTIAQIVEARVEGDHILVSAHSRQLVRDFGWKGYCGNTPAAYLTGLLCGLRGARAGVGKAILDIGLQAPVRGGRVFAVVKGVIDGGVEVPCDPEVLPDEGRLRGVHIAEYARALAEKDPQAYERRFSRYLARGLRPEDLPQHFDEVRSRILSSFGVGEGA
ncbi:50S ribosomal protein L18 [Candidatus Bathyarchaeota archaeon]|nr:MAG: 50S ribosomal protein L18 [Candidatus Bathyarchaeota archaeon]